MAYSDYTLRKIRTELKVKNRIVSLFEKLEPTKPDEWLIKYLEKAGTINIQTEKAKSEAIVFPILLELKQKNKKFITMYSGNNLNVDSKIGLNGECDFIISKNTESFEINYPIMQIVEAKNHDIRAGIPQCAAQMIGAKIYNEQNEINLNIIYGCVTTGDDWLFLKLENEMLYIDKRKYYLNELGELLSVFQYIINYYKKILKPNLT